MKQASCAKMSLILLGVIGCIVGTIVISYLAINPASARALQKEFGSSVVNLCAWPPSGDAVGAPVGTHAPLKALVLERGGKRWHPWADALPAEWKATNREDVGLVVCVDRKTIEDFVCYAGSVWGSNSGGKVKVEVDEVIVIDPVSEEVLTRIPFRVAGYQPCSAPREGTPEEFLAALEPYILGTNTP